MTTNNNLLRNLRVATPCHIGWENMSGNDRVRFCESCQLNVYNLSEMTSDEVKSLILKSEGRLCGRMYRRADGTVITRDCPVGIRALRKKMTSIAAAVFATILSASSVVFSQIGSKDKSCKQIPALKLERKPIAKDQAPGFSGTVTDPFGAVIRGAEVTLRRKSTSLVMTLTTNDEGKFTFASLADDVYEMKITLTGFKTLAVKAVTLRSNESSTATVVLNPSIEGAMVGLLIAEPDIQTSGGTTIIRGDFIRKLPINN